MRDPATHHRYEVWICTPYHRQRVAAYRWRWLARLLAWEANMTGTYEYEVWDASLGA